jgi:hypothetical protein
VGFVRSRIIGLLTFAVVAVGVAVGVYFAGQASDGTTAAQEDDGTTTAHEDAENRLATAEALLQQWLAEGTVPPALTITPYPTCPPDPPTPTPIPGEESTYWPVTPAPWPCIPADQPLPDKTPDLSSLFQRAEEPEECEGCINLGKPVPYEVPMKVGGKEIHLPTGSTHKLHIRGCPPMGVPDRAPCSPALLHVVERGDSKVVIDSGTGEIIEWNVAHEDEADFRRLILEPLQPLQ